MSNKERIGVNKIESKIIEDIGWIFREQTTEDYGVDAQIEIVENKPTHIIAGVQIKYGESHFNILENEFTFLVKERHFKYWTNSSVPIFLMFYIPLNNQCYWQLLSNPDLYENTNTQFKISIPKLNVLDGSAKIELAQIIEIYYNKFDQEKSAGSDLLDLDNFLKDTIEDVHNCLELIAKHILDFGFKTRSLTSELKSGKFKGKKDPKLVRLISNFSVDMQSLSSRLIPEKQILTTRYRNYIDEWINFIKRVKTENDYEPLRCMLDLFVGCHAKQLDQSFDYAINGTIILKQSIQGLSAIKIDSFRKGRKSSQIQIVSLIKSLELMKTKTLELIKEIYT